MEKQSYDVIVIGGGPAGMMAAICAASDGASVLLLERNESLGKKLLLTGHGRCNITNTQALERLPEKYFEQGRFLNSEFHRYSPQRVREIFEEWGVPTHEEENGRIFPDSQKSKTVLDALLQTIQASKIEVHCSEAVQALYKEKENWKVVTEEDFHYASSVVLACGGKAFPQTGSIGDGLRLASKVGHTIQPLVPALAPILIREESGVATLSGITIPDVALKLMVEDKKIAQSEGDLLFTHQGFSGPSAMRLSRNLPEPEKTECYRNGHVKVVVNMLPKWQQDELNEHLILAMSASPNRPIRRIVKELSGLPERVVDYVLGEDARELLCHEVTKVARRTILRNLQESVFTIEKPASWETAYVTRGGVSLKEIQPKTMESKCQAGLFFAGEIMDIDGDSGGYNLQHAWASGAIAGHSCSTLSRMPQTMMDAQNIR